MMYHFRIIIDPIWGTANITLNQQAVSTQSQLQVCSAHNFFDWFNNLPNMFFSEVNDNYSVTVESITLQYELLRIVFSTVNECQSLNHIKKELTYSVEQRFAWLSEVSSKTCSSLPEVPCFSILSTKGPLSFTRTVIESMPAFYRKFWKVNANRVNIWLAAKDGLTSIPDDTITDYDIILCEDVQGKRNQTHSVPILYIEKSAWATIIKEWADQMIFIPYLIHCQEIIKQHKKASSFEIDSRVQMLTRDEPYVLFSLPQRVEVGTTCPIRINEFPPSSLCLKTSDPNCIVQQKDHLLAKQPGRAVVSLVSEKGSVLQRNNVEVFSVIRVTSINLKSGKGNTLLLGDSFSIQATCLPQGAENLAKAVWTVSPDHILKNQGNGCFSTCSPGKCTVSLTIESVSQSIQLNVVPLCRDIQLPSEIKVKAKAAPYRVSASLLPTGSACREIRCSVADKKIAQWDSNIKSLVPLSEGSTSLEAVAIGPLGNVLFVKSCPVTILPEKDIINPPTLVTLAICCAILSLLTSNSVFGHVTLLACGVLGSITGIINWIPVIKHQCTLSNKIQAVIATICVVFSIVCFFLMF